MAVRLPASFGSTPTQLGHPGLPGGSPASGRAAALCVSCSSGPGRPGNCGLPVGRGRSRPLPCGQVSKEIAWGHLFHPPPQAAAEVLLQIFTTRSKRRQPLGAFSATFRGKAPGCGRTPLHPSQPQDCPTQRREDLGELGITHDCSGAGEKRSSL